VQTISGVGAVKDDCLSVYISAKTDLSGAYFCYPIQGATKSYDLKKSEKVQLV